MSVRPIIIGILSCVCLFGAMPQPCWSQTDAEDADNTLDESGLLDELTDGNPPAIRRFRGIQHWF